MKKLMEKRMKKLDRLARNKQAIDEAFDKAATEHVYGKRPACVDTKPHILMCCGATKDLHEIDGAEFYTDSVDDLVVALKQYKAVHLAYWTDEEDKDLDLWVKAV